MKWTLLTSSLIVSILGVQGSASASGLITGQVVEILGGDNVLIEVNGYLINVDLAYIQPLSELAAFEHLQDILPSGTPVQLDPAWVDANNTHYGYLYADGMMVNANLLSVGVSHSPWTVPNPAIQHTYTQAINGSLGLGPTVVSGDVTPGSGGALSWPGVGIGLALLVTFAAVTKGVTRKSSPVSVQANPKQLQQSLTATLTAQKQLERQYADAQKEVELWQERAKIALQNQDEDLAREALVRKKASAETVAQLEQSLIETKAQAENLRSTPPVKDS